MTTKWVGIAKLQEELGELQAVLGKLHAYPDGQHPDMRYAKPLLERLHDELGDVLASCLYYCEANASDIDCQKVQERIDFKLARYRKWRAEGDHLVGVEVEE